MLGIIIGVSAVITVVALAQGVSQNINSQFASLGTNTLTVMPSASQSSSGVRSSSGSAQTLTRYDADAIAQLAHVVSSSPIIQANEQIVYQDTNWNTTVSGVYPNYQQTNNWKIAEGSWFTDQAESQSESVAVLGATTAQQLYPSGTNPVGTTIRVGSALFHVIGVLQAKGSSGGGNSDDTIFVPFSAAFNHLNSSSYVSQIQVQADTTNNLTLVEQEITSLLRQRHNLVGPDVSATATAKAQKQRPGGAFGGGPGGGGPGGGGPGGGGGGGSNSQKGSGSGNSLASQGEADDFQIFNVQSIVQSAQQTSTLLEVLLVGIAGISLAVGGIGIMNIMLVSVTERTREIGLRMAIGARRRDVRNQFLVEAIMLCAAGGVIGILIGLGGGYALVKVIGLPYVISPYPALIAFVVSSAVGILFGYYPAARASKLDPITALRTE